MSQYGSIHLIKDNVINYIPVEIEGHWFKKISAIDYLVERGNQNFVIKHVSLEQFEHIQKLALLKKAKSNMMQLSKKDIIAVYQKSISQDLETNKRIELFDETKEIEGSVIITKGNMIYQSLTKEPTVDSTSIIYYTDLTMKQLLIEEIKKHQSNFNFFFGGIKVRPDAFRAYMENPQEIQEKMKSRKIIS